MKIGIILAICIGSGLVYVGSTMNTRFVSSLRQNTLKTQPDKLQRVGGEVVEPTAEKPVVFEVIELNDKVLTTKAEYDIEKVKIATAMKDFGEKPVTFSELDDWDKVLEREKCKATIANVNLPNDYLKIIQSTAIKIASGGC